jgi:hypothetical protein
VSSLSNALLLVTSDLLIAIDCGDNAAATTVMDKIPTIPTAFHSHWHWWRQLQPLLSAIIWTLVPHP